MHVHTSSEYDDGNVDGSGNNNELWLFVPMPIQQSDENCTFNKIYSQLCTTIIIWHANVKRRMIGTHNNPTHFKNGLKTRSTVLLLLLYRERERSAFLCVCWCFCWLDSFLTDREWKKMKTDKGLLSSPSEKISCWWKGTWKFFFFA